MKKKKNASHPRILKIKGFQELIDSIMIGEPKPKKYLKQKLSPYKKIFKF